MSNSSSHQPDIILFHYPFSPWSQKITAYLAFRGIAYTECHQPVTMPRPDLATLGVEYRRIPVMSIGRDIYCDTLLMLEKVEELCPQSHLGAETGYDRAMERLLEKWTDVVVFKYAAAAIPTDFPVMKDEAFVKDRTELWGRDWKSQHQEKLRPEALTVLKGNFEFLEKTIFEDGRRWVLGGDNPGLADIHGAWILQWLMFDVPNALPEEVFSTQAYPNTVAWLQRYREAVANAKERAPKPKLIEGKDAVDQILAADFGEAEGRVDSNDATGLQKGTNVEAWPVDTGFKHRDKGKLVALTSQETVLETSSDKGTAVRVHHPRWNFQVEASGQDDGAGDVSSHHSLEAHGGDEGLGAEHYAERQ